MGDATLGDGAFGKSQKCEDSKDEALVLCNGPDDSIVPVDDVPLTGDCTIVGLPDNVGVAGGGRAVCKLQSTNSSGIDIPHVYWYCICQHSSDV